MTNIRDTLADMAVKAFNDAVIAEIGSKAQAYADRLLRVIHESPDYIYPEENIAKAWSSLESLAHACTTFANLAKKGE